MHVPAGVFVLNGAGGVCTISVPVYALEYDGGPVLGNEATTFTVAVAVSVAPVLSVAVKCTTYVPILG